MQRRLNVRGRRVCKRMLKRCTMGRGAEVIHRTAQAPGARGYCKWPLVRYAGRCGRPQGQWKRVHILNTAMEFWLVKMMKLEQQGLEERAYKKTATQIFCRTGIIERFRLGCRAAKIAAPTIPVMTFHFFFNTHDYSCIWMRQLPLDVKGGAFQNLPFC